MVDSNNEVTKNMIAFRNRIYVGSAGRKSVFDACIRADDEAVVVFVHGYKGFKDWGAWNLVEKNFLDRGFGFVKFNMSHNGGTVANPIDFSDLEAFAQNRYSWEVADLNTIVAETQKLIKSHFQTEKPIYVTGHSRGGGIAVLAGCRNKEISKIISLAGICDIGSRFPIGENLLLWEQEGVMYAENARTKQQMPHNFSMYEDYLDNQDDLSIEKAAGKLSAPFLQIHGDMDTSVSISEGIKLAEWTNSELAIVKGADHTFGAQEPWIYDVLPEDLKEAINRTLAFLKSDIA